CGCHAGVTGGRSTVMNNLYVPWRGGRRIRRPVWPRVAATGLGLLALGYLMQLMPPGTPGRGYWPWLMIGYGRTRTGPREMKARGARPPRSANRTRAPRPPTSDEEAVP